MEYIDNNLGWFNNHFVHLLKIIIIINNHFVLLVLFLKIVLDWSCLSMKNLKMNDVMCHSKLLFIIFFCHFLKNNLEFLVKF